jgi:hypothetical protein
MKSVRVEKFKDFLIPIWNRIIELLEEGVNSGVFKYTSLSNALSFVMSVAVFPRQLPYFIDTVSEEHKNIEKTIEELIEFILKGLSWLGHLLIPGIFDGEHTFELMNEKLKQICESK